MKYTKPPLTFEQQADLLLGRGLSADRPTLLARLQAVSYYRLSAYWRAVSRSLKGRYSPAQGTALGWGRQQPFPPCRGGIMTMTTTATTTPDAGAIVAPCRGAIRGTCPVPRALPWADELCPCGAEDGKTATADNLGPLLKELAEVLAA